MVAQLIRQDDGSYDYVEVATPKPLATTNLLSQVSTEAAKPLPVTDEFEAYEGIKKGGDELISAPSITEQTQQELEVATLERDLFRCQGKLALVRQLLNLPEAHRRNKEKL